MNAMKSISLKRILSAKTESVLVTVAVALATATLLTAFSLSKNYIDFFIAEAEHIMGCSMSRIFSGCASNMVEIAYYMKDYVLYFISGAGAGSRETGSVPPPAAYNSDAIFSAEASVENFPVLAAVMLIIVLFTVSISLSVIFSVCKRNRRSFYATLLVSGASDRFISRCMLYESVYYCAVAIPLGCIISCAEIYTVRFAAYEIFEKLSLSYGGIRFPVEINFSVLALAVTVPVIFLSVLRHSEKAVKKLSVKTAVSDTKKGFVADIGICTFSAEPKSYKRLGGEFHVAVRNFQNNVLKYLQIIFITVMCIAIIGMTLIIYSAVGNYNNFDAASADISMIAFTHSSEIYFCAVTAALSILTLLCTFSSVSANIDSNTVEYALMRSSGSSLKSILRAVKIEGGMCCFFGTFFSALAVTIIGESVIQIYREDSRVVFGNHEITAAVVGIAAALFVICVTATVFMQSRKMKKLDLIAVLKDLFY